MRQKDGAGKTHLLKGIISLFHLQIKILCVKVLKNVKNLGAIILEFSFLLRIKSDFMLNIETLM